MLENNSEKNHLDEIKEKNRKNIFFNLISFFTKAELKD